jgi:hypothetical protein
MDQLLSALQFLVQQRTYLIAAAALVAIVFVLRVMGAAGEIELKYIMPLYLVGGFSALVLATQAVPAVDGEDPFKDVKKVRNAKKADIVGLIVEDTSGCGLSTRVGAGAEEAYFVVHHSCATITISIAHEVGHILGARHDRSIDANNRPFAYGHGYVNGSKWRDIMSYHKGCNGTDIVAPQRTLRGDVC